MGQWADGFDGRGQSQPTRMRMLDLPDGTVLFTPTDSGCGIRSYMYQPAGAPLAAGQLAINSIYSERWTALYTLNGTLLNGISEGAAYGDDAQMNSNYPLIRMTNILSGHAGIMRARTTGAARAWR